MFDSSRLIVNMQFLGYCTILSDYLGELGVNALQLSVEAPSRTMTNIISIIIKQLVTQHMSDKNKLSNRSCGH